MLDRWDGTTLVRTADAGAEVIAYACTIAGSSAAPRLAVTVARPEHEATVAEALQAMFVHAPGDSLARLMAADPVIAGLEARYPGVRPVIRRDGFTALVHAISAQQVNLAWATTTRRRLAEAFGQRHTLGPHVVYSLSPARLAVATVPQLRALQFTTRKAEYIIDLAQRLSAGTLDLAALADLPDEAVIAELVKLRGLGRWTAEWYLARTLGRPVVAAGDLGVRKAVGAAYRDGTLPSESQVRQLTAHWGAAAGVAQQLLLHGLGEGMGFPRVTPSGSPPPDAPAEPVE